MENQPVRLFFICTWALLITLFSSKGYCNAEEFCPFNGSISRSSFPSGFTFGAGSSAYQVEGAADLRGPNIWDNFSHTPGHIADNSTGDVSVDQYHCYREDIQLLKKMGTDAYRFSISWARIFPNGSPRKGEINDTGVQHYNSLIDELIHHGIQPFVTLFHWDVPLSLELEYGGFQNESIVEDFAAFANACFAIFGDRVKHWTTLNEPTTVAFYGYDYGTHAPGRNYSDGPGFASCSLFGCVIPGPAQQPYIVAHNMLLAHAEASRIYKRDYQQIQKGVVGITLLGQWYLPFDSTSDKDNEAAQRMLNFTIGWFLEPLTAGDYPLIMRNNVGDRLPKFTESQSKELKSSLDFLGINYYTSKYAADEAKPYQVRCTTDPRVNITAYNASGHPIGDQSAGAKWLYVYPRGIYDLLKYASSRFKKNIYVTENGYPDANEDIPSPHMERQCINPDVSEDKGIPSMQTRLGCCSGPVDKRRLCFHYDHLAYVLRAIKEGANISGYFAWSLTDSFEWNAGYTVRFGLHFVDYKRGLRRIAKLSACWFHGFLSNWTAALKPENC